VIRRALKPAAVLMLAVLLAGCAAGAAFRRGQDAAREQDWDAAVAHYREALQANPDRAEYRIALERAMMAASRAQLETARAAEARGEIDEAARAYRRAAEYDASNRHAATKAAELDRMIRDRIEASRRPAIDRMREQARRASPEPELLSLTEPIPLLRFNNQSVREILNFIGGSTGVSMVFAQDFQDRAYSVNLQNATLEQALRQILSANQLFYKVLSERSILILPDNPQNRARYEEQVVRTFFLSHADATEIQQLLNQVLRVPGLPIIPTIAANKTRNTITVRGTAALVTIMERVIEANDRPPAEVVLDVSILEVSRERAKQFGLDLGQYSITGTISPGGEPDEDGNVPPFTLRSLRGLGSGDVFLSVPQAVVRFLESDSQTRLVAKPQLRGQEGQDIKLNLGDRIPVLSTTFGSLGGPGSVANQPISSFQYEDIGVNVTMTPRVTVEGDVVLALTVESSTLGNPISVAGQSVPTFGNRRVEARIRLRDGESTMLAGLLREDTRNEVTGPIGLMRLPVFRQLFSRNQSSRLQTDIVMLITPHIVRSQELRQQDVDPIYIGTQQNLGLNGPPPLIAPGTSTAAEGAPPSPDGSEGPGPDRQPGAMPGTLPAPGIMPLPHPEQPARPPAPQTPAATPEGAPNGTPPVSETADPVVVPRDTTAGGTQAQTTPAPGLAQVAIASPGTEFRVGAGPYTVPLSISGAPRVSTLALTLTFDPGVLRVRSVQEGSFMRQGGVNATFAQQVDAAAGRVDITLSRPQDLVGASGSGLLAAVLFDAVAGGSATLSVSGAGSGPAGAAVAVQSMPVTITVR
jgi:general secretion pathway protein D